MARTWIATLLLVGLGLGALAGQQANQTTQPTRRPYRIESVTPGRPPTKATVNVRLRTRPTSEEMSTIARQIHEQHGEGLERLFIFHYLEDQDERVGPYATTHFNTELEVKVWGMSDDELKSALGHEAPKGAEVLGRWENAGILSMVVVIYRLDDAYFLRWDGAEKPGEADKVLRDQLGDGWRFRFAERESGDYYVLRSDGRLEMRDADGTNGLLPKRK